MKALRPILIDIETAPAEWWRADGSSMLYANREAAAAEPPKTVSSKGADEVLAWRAGKAGDLFAGCSLQVHRCQIVCVCIQTPAGELLTIADDRDELAVLEGLSVAMASIWKTRTGALAVVAWNGKRFDFPMLAGRYMLTGQPERAAQWNSCIRYQDRRDLGLRAGSLRFIDAHDTYPMASGDRTRLRDLDTPEMQTADPLRGDGGQVLPALLEGRMADVVTHCQVDVRDRLATVWGRVHAQMLALSEAR